MDNLLAVIQADEEPEFDSLDINYQKNMFTIEQAMRDTGAMKPLVAYTVSPYDKELMRLINAVPMN